MDHHLGYTDPKALQDFHEPSSARVIVRTSIMALALIFRATFGSRAKTIDNSIQSPQPASDFHRANMQHAS